MSTEIALQRKISDAVSEYNYKQAAIAETLKSFEEAGEKLKENA